MGVTHDERLRSLIYAQGDEDRDAEITDIVAEMEIGPQRNVDRHLLYEVRKRYPSALAKGLLRRVSEDSTLFYGADDILAAADFSLEDIALLKIALAETGRRDDRAETAASVLGPKAVGQMIEAYLEAQKHTAMPTANTIKREVIGTTTFGSASGTRPARA